MRKLTYPVAALLFACLSASSAFACCDTEEKAIMAKCTTDQLTAGKSQADAEKSCKCGYDLMRSKLKDDPIILFAAMMNGEAGVKGIIAQKGMEWFQANLQEITKVAPEIDKTCGTK